MFDELLNLVKQHAGEAIVDNPSIPNEKNDEAINDASASITNGLQGMLSQGGLKDILNMFGGQPGSNAAVSNGIAGGLIQNLMDKFGLDKQQADNVAGKIVPNVLDDMVKKTNDPGDNSFDIQGIFNNLSGGQTSGFNMQGLLSKLKGGQLDLDGDGDTDLQDLMKLFSGKGGGILNNVKSLLGS